MKTSTLAIVALAACLGLSTLDADAKRLGGGRNSGLQRDMPARTAPDAPPAKPATPQQATNPAQQAAPATPGAAAAGAQAAAPKRSWMGPLAGLAAGLGLAALFSSLGIGEGLGSFLLMLLLAGLAFFVIKKLLARRQPQAAGMAYRAAPAGGSQVAWPTPAPGAGTPVADKPVVDTAPAAPAAEPVAQPAAAPAATPARAFVPAAFDAEGFARTAKMIYIRLQAANDAGDLEDLRSFTTPEMFADLSLDVRERGAARQHTEVLQIEPEVLDVANEDTRQVVSVRFRGEVREAAGATPSAVDEVWHLTKPHDGSRGWAVAGIEQWR